MNNLEKENQELKVEIKHLTEQKERHLQENASDKNQWREDKEKFINEITKYSEIIQELTNWKELMQTELEAKDKSKVNIEEIFHKLRKESEGEIEYLKLQNKKLTEQLITIRKQYDYEVLPLREKLKIAYKQLEKYNKKCQKSIIKDKMALSSFKKIINNQKKQIITLKNSQCKYAQQTHPEHNIIFHQKSIKRSVSKHASPHIQHKRNTSSIPRSCKNSIDSIIMKSGCRTFRTNRKNSEYKIPGSINIVVPSQITKDSVERMKNKLNLQPEGSFIVADNKEELQINNELDEILRLEREIADLNYQYNNLTGKLVNNTELGGGLDNLIKLIADKNEKLKQLRTKQCFKQQY